jgi:serine/threonine-protein kinase
MAEVYKGYHPQLDRFVAIKIVGRHLEEPDAAFNARFRREAKAIAKLRHPNIVQVYDFGAAENGHYMVMEYIEGADLGDVLIDLQAQRRLLEQDDITFIVRQIGLALDHAHSKGVIHRDVKPGNVMITRAGQAILTDFGLALLQSRHAEDMSQGTAFGTPEYIAPEQVTDSRVAGPATDLYSLGVVLYEMVTGRLPFQAKTAIDLALKHVNEKPTDPRELDGDIAPAVAAVIMKAMRKEPAERFRSGNALATALERAYRDPLNVDFVDPPTRPARPPMPKEGEPVVNRGPGGTEAQQAKARIQAEITAEERERKRQERERKRAERRKKRRRFFATWWRTIVVLLIVTALVGAAGYLLQTLGVLDVNIGGQRQAEATAQPTAAPAEGSAANTPAITTPTLTAPPPTPTDAPTATPAATATPLQQAEATAAPPVVIAPPVDGESAFRLVDGQAIQFVGSGVFTMGTDDTFRNESDRPAHPVRLGDYWLDRTEVTNVQYALCVEEGPCAPPDPEQTANYYFDPEFADYPVTYVSYDAAVTYCLWLANETEQQVGLPTEAQWEKAARWDPAEEVAYDYPWGNEPPNPNLLRYNESNVLFPAAEVGSYPEGASPYGVYDMAGNVWEWVADWFDPDYYDVTGVLVDPTGPLTGTFRVTRGGSWTRSGSLALSSVRNPTRPTIESNEIGFRCAVTGARLPAESGIYATPLDVTTALLARIEASREAGTSDTATLDEWVITLTELETGLRGAANAEARGIVADRVGRIAVQVNNDLLDGTLGYRLEQGLLWIAGQLEGEG